MRVRFLQVAKTELDDAVDYYNLILILAIARLHREPDYWIDRWSDENR